MPASTPPRSQKITKALRHLFPLSQRSSAYVTKPLWIQVPKIHSTEILPPPPNGHTVEPVYNGTPSIPSDTLWYHLIPLLIIALNSPNTRL